ncbi:hypothetical protein RJ639_015191 [Escallonia herrerae]|uniref:Chloride channel-like protein CLC-g n=1 Tax=Escallonia herrerae TaxID=1293975 RepID=A0AA88VGE7_9ASTE|nr:hypothetical protein RJ639_015191 [Escallonia herrerae]
MSTTTAAAFVANGDEESITNPLLPLRRSASNATSQVAIVGSNLCPIESLDYESALSLSLLLYTSSNFGLTLFSCVITALVAPEAAGSGIPEVKAYLNGVDAPAIFSIRTLFVKIVGSITAVSASLHVGKAGPMVHIGACIAAIMGQGGSKKYWLTWKWLRFFKNDRDRRDLVTCGSAAGIAAAFRAPVGGVLFALEEMASWYCQHVNPSALLKGTACKILLACLISITTSCLLFGLPWLASCRTCPADASEPCPTIGRSGNYKKFQCSPGQYNDLASLFFNTNDDAIKNLFSKGTDSEFHASSILIFFVTCFFLSIFSYGIVAPAGLFVPVILTGASYGRFIGMLVGSHSNLNHGLFAVLGSASLLGGSMRMTVSLCVIILELTNNLLLLPLIMLVLLVSKTVADAFNGNIYDLIMKLKGFPYLETHAEPYMRQLTVGDVVTGPLQLFHGVEKVGNIVHVLETTGHNGFPIIDESPRSEAPVLFGLVLRAYLIMLLKKKAFLLDPVRTDIDAFKQFSAEDFGKKGLGRGDRIEDIELTEEEMEMFIDLHPFSNASPYTVVETMSLAKALTLFREVGLRHLLVIPKISGIKVIPSTTCPHFYLVNLQLMYPEAALDNRFPYNPNDNPQT